MSNLPLVGQSELMYSQECDESTIALLYSQVDSFLAGSMTQSARAAIEPEVQLICRALYHGFTTAAGRITIGEEYADVFPVLLQSPPQGSESSVLVARLLNGWPRIAAVIARTVLPWLQARWAFVEAKAAEVLRYSRVGVAYRCLLQCALVLGSAVKQCSPAISQLHLLLFHLAGAHFLLSNRILGIRYVKRTPRYLSFPLFPLRIVGVLQIIRIIIIALKQLARASAQRQLSSARVDIQFTEGLSLAAAADAAAEPDADEAEAAAGNAPSCPLCLCSRKQAQAACTACGHVFCWRCIAEWLVKKPECPLCRSSCEIKSLIPLRFYDSL